VVVILSHWVKGLRDSLPSVLTAMPEPCVVGDGCWSVDPPGRIGGAGSRGRRCRKYGGCAGYHLTIPCGSTNGSSAKFPATSYGYSVNIVLIIAGRGPPNVRYSARLSDLREAHDELLLAGMSFPNRP
jgi:hypothetical protein